MMSSSGINLQQTYRFVVARQAIFPFAKLAKLVWKTRILKVNGNIFRTVTRIKKPFLFHEQIRQQCRYGHTHESYI